MTSQARERSAIVSDGSNEKELRIGLVCYGGVSLAIYMHGVVAAIHSLVRASLGFEEHPVDNPFAGGRLESVFWEMLKERQQRDAGVATRVIVDTVAGTSAGGINGITLAKALAHDLDQSPLRDLWIEKGDINDLLVSHYVPSLPLKLATWVVAGRLLPRITPMPPRTPLDGDRMLGWLLDALTTMDRTGSAQSSLMPAGHRLELFVTATDFHGYPQIVPIHDPEQIIDREHRHVLRFSYQDGNSQFGPSYNPALAFAARATSSFPGAFAPVSFADVKAQVPDWDEQAFEDEFFAIYKDAEVRARGSYFIDGGVLDNFPFRHAIDAIIAKPAGVEVERYLIYIEPNPGDPTARPSKKEPGWLGTIWAGIAGLPSEEPISDDLEYVAAFNRRVAQVSTFIEDAFDEVNRVVDAGDNLYEVVDERFGPRYQTYLRFKLDSVVDTLGRLAAELAGFHPDSELSAFVRRVVHRWAHRAGLLEPDAGRLTTQQLEFLRTFDLGYGQRRIRFVIQGLNRLYQDVDAEPDRRPTRREIDTAKAALYDYLERLDIAGIVASTDTEALRHHIAEIFDRDQLQAAWAGDGTEAAVKGHLEHIGPQIDRAYDDAAALLDTNLTGFQDDLAAAVDEMTSNWNPDAHREIRTRYYGFPLFDAQVYPLRLISDVGELQPIRVARMSPEEATTLSTEGATKLEGVKLHHFGAFFDRQGRERDYLWGRLDTAERLVQLTLGAEADDVTTAALKAILTEEKPNLPHIGDFINHLAQKTETTPLRR